MRTTSLKLLYLDCFAGASGDMILGALLDAGLPLAELQRVLDPLLSGGSTLSAERVVKGGVSATRFRLVEPHHHHHHHGHHHATPNSESWAAGSAPHRHHSMEQIHALIAGSGLSPAGKARAGALFDRLASVEGDIHQTPPERVHLHEVGALDSIVDIVGSVFAFEWFGAGRTVCSPLNVGGGTVTCSHGVLPVPAPATLRLLEGLPVYSSGPEGELVTPTGALLVAGYADAFGQLPAMRIERIGYGAGERDVPGRPNVLRVLVGTSSTEAQIEPLVVLECEIDDMNPQLFGSLMDRLQAAGALDVFFTPVQMKKNRPGTLVTVLASPDRREALSTIVFAETTTIGLRWYAAERERLDREIVSVDTPYGAARVKVATRAGQVLNVSPEFDDCTRLASAAGVSVKEAHELVMHAYWTQNHVSSPKAQGSRLESERSSSEGGLRDSTREP